MKNASSFSGSSALVALRDFDWRRLQRLTDPQSVKDFDTFLDNLPERAGKNALIIAGSIWAIAAVGLFLLFHNAQSLKEIQKQLAIAEGTRIAVPQITYNPVDAQIIRPIVDKLKKIYPSLIIDVQDGSAIGIKAASTRDFTLWRSAIGDIAYGAPAWKLSVKKLCAGRDCQGEPLQVVIIVQNVDIALPPAPSETEVPVDEVKKDSKS
jgi:hypothetical protein